MLWLRILGALVFLTLFGWATHYVYRRMVRDTVKAPWLRALLALVLVSIFLAVPILRFAFRGSVPPRDLALVFLTGWGVFLYILLTLLTVELVRWVRRKRVKAPEAPVDPERRLLLSRAVAASALGVGSSAAVFGAWRAFTPPELTELHIKLPGLPKALDGFTLVQLSDVHVGAIIRERFLDELVSRTNAAKPDLIAITGDLVDGTVPQLGRFVARLRNLQSRYGTHFVSGNHDYYSGWEEWAPELEKLGFVVLRNRTVSIGDAGGSFDLIGVDDWGHRTLGDGYDLDAAVRGRDPERASVLMAHQPNGLDLASAQKIGLQLSGHTHGGQLFPGTVLGSVIWGSRNAGLSVHDGTHLYTSRGCGFVGPPMRIGAPPELVKIVLTA